MVSFVEDNSGREEEYRSLLHAVQTGVKMQMQISGLEASGADAKHLRVGINSAMINDAALVSLLIKKGIITLVEYYDEMIAEARREKLRYEKILSEHYGKPVVLA